MKKIILIVVIGLVFGSLVSGQIPMAALVKIVKAEDARAYDKTLEDLIKVPNSAVRLRAALAAGRIGSDAAIPLLSILLENDPAIQVREMAAFALGEIESIKAADTILKTLQDPKTPDAIRARAIEAAGKIAAANAKDEKAKALGEAVLDTLEAQEKLGARQNRDVILLALTAALRGKPTDADFVVAKFLTNLDARIRANAANTLSRLRAKNANETLRAMLLSDADPIARANAARALGAAEDKEALNLLLEAATNDEDSRVRVSAIRSLAALKDAKAADKLLERGDKLLKQIAIDPSVLRLLSKPVPSTKPLRNPVEKNELLEIATALGRLLPNSRNEKVMNFLDRFITIDDGRSAEIAVARMRVAPGNFNSRNEVKPLSNWRQYSTLAQTLGEFSKVEAKTDEVKKMKEEAPGIARLMAEAFAIDPSRETKNYVLAAPDFLQAFAEYKTEDLPKILRDALQNKDIFIRATAAGLLAEQPASKETVEALRIAFTKSLFSDNDYNDAQLAILDALFKLDKQASVGALIFALNASDYLVRKKAFELSNDKDLQKEFPNILKYRDEALSKRKDQVLLHTRVSGSKLGQLLNTDADYRRAVSRKNGSIKAVLTTEKGIFTIVFNPEEAPLTVDNFVKLARSGYFNGLEVHRVVPNFVMQDGDPRGDGNGGPGWSIRCEVNMLPFDRGAVGMALSGKDTGGSQWFVTHSPQPHLDGGYTVFGHVNNVDTKVVDNIVRGDKIISVKIIERGLPQRKIK